MYAAASSFFFSSVKQLGFLFLNSMDCSNVFSHPLFTASACSSTSRYFPASAVSLSSRGRLSVSQHEDPVPDKPSAQSTTSFLSLLCPLLKLFSGGDPSRQRNFFLEDATSSLSTLARYPWGSAAKVTHLADQPLLPLQLFEFEACPFCRRVREAMTELDLSAEVYPCPKGSKKHRAIVQRMGGKEQFPFLVDPNTGKSLFESGDIVTYLFAQYGKGNPSAGLLESTLITGWVPTILRAGRGMTLWENTKLYAPPTMLQLFSYENNPKARIVREVLCELELPYILHNVGQGSIREKLLLQTSGSLEVPYLIDPNTGTQMGSYKKIISYLFKTYCTATISK